MFLVRWIGNARQRGDTRDMAKHSMHADQQMQMCTGRLPMITLLLVDDDAFVRQGLRTSSALETDMQVVGEASDGADASADRAITA